jgi:gamma-glutamyl-gamma-aminobutyrate hydrolase PuuD
MNYDDENVGANMKLPTVFIVAPSWDYETMFKENGFTLVDNVNDADLLCFTGGEDVSPHMYGEEAHVTTYSSFRRDEEEKEIFLKAKALGLPMVGVCRGGQFLNVMSGGSLWQNVDGHAIGGTHPVLDIDTGRSIDCTSTHHQMMIVGRDGLLVGSAQQGSFKQCVTDGVVVTEQSDEDTVDVEIVYYHGTSSLCFQPHPEYFAKGEDCPTYFFELITKYLGVSA